MQIKQKELIASELKSDLNKAKSVLVLHYSGLTVDEVNKVRINLKKQGAVYKVINNNVIKFAITDTPYAHLSDAIKGPTALSYSLDDELVVPKVICEYIKKNKKLKIIAGGLSDKQLLLDDIKYLATIPSLEELRGKIVGLLQAPLAKLIQIVTEPSRKIVRVLDVYTKK